jgi:hypothetical protein
MKANNAYKRTHTKTPGASEAAAPRSHAAPAASETGGSKEARPKRTDIIRRHLLTARKDKEI